MTLQTLLAVNNFRRSSELWRAAGRRGPLLLALLALATALLLLAPWEAQAKSNASRPTNLTATFVSGSGVVLSWNAPTEDAESVTGYQVLRRLPLQGEPRPTVYVADTGSTGTAYTDGDATVAGEQYNYRVKALRGDAVSRMSNLGRVTVPESTPTPEPTPTPTPEPTPTPTPEPTPEPQKAEQATPEPTVNQIATGKPVIEGSVAVGETLTVDTSNIADGNGLTNVKFRYQWLHSNNGVDVDIPDATGDTYTPTEADADNAFKVRVSFADDEGNSERLTSKATTILVISATQTYSSHEITIEKAYAPNRHNGSTALVTLTFSEPVQATRGAFKSAITVTKGRIKDTPRAISATQHGRHGREFRSNKWYFQVVPSSEDSVVSLYMDETPAGDTINPALDITIDKPLPPPPPPAKMTLGGSQILPENFGDYGGLGDFDSDPSYDPEQYDPNVKSTHPTFTLWVLWWDIVMPDHGNSGISTIKLFDGPQCMGSRMIDSFPASKYFPFPTWDNPYVFEMPANVFVSGQYFSIMGEGRGGSTCTTLQ